MSLTTLVKSIQDIMRQDAGVDGDAQRISQLVWMLFMKIFDDKEKEHEFENDHYESPMPDRLRWRNWAADEEGMTGDELQDFINNDLFKTLKEMQVGPDSDPREFLVKEVFVDSYNYMKSGTLLRQVVNKINQINFNDLKDRHVFNELYEKILKDLQSAGNAGEYYTPRAVTQFMTDMVDPQLGETVLDPACGTGGFLVCALENMRKQAKTAEDWNKIIHSIIGVEKKPMPHLLSVTNLILHDIEVPQIKRDNSLSRRPLRDYSDADRVDVVLTNPPFGGTEEPGVENNFPAAYRTRETADLFLLLIMQLLKDGGRAAVVLPDGFLFGEGVKTRIKGRLLERCNLHTIVRLPNGVFNPYTGIKTNLLFLTKGEPTKEIWYYEHPYPEGYKSYSKTKPLRIEEFEPEKEWWNKREENEFSWRLTFDEIKTNSFNLDFKNPNAN
ncbi:MAG: N-6 DNA methylase [Candidatus Hodarchaeales archaeon]|jgi:type I restriction enzyme M protein